MSGWHLLDTDSYINQPATAVHKPSHKENIPKEEEFSLSKLFAVCLFSHCS